MRTLFRSSFLLLVLFAHALAYGADPAPGTFRVWVFSDAHVGTDKEKGRESLATALRQSESATGFASLVEQNELARRQDPTRRSDGRGRLHSSVLQGSENLVVRS